jgi:hypothetical protein
MKKLIAAVALSGLVLSAAGLMASAEEGAGHKIKQGFSNAGHTIVDDTKKVGHTIAKDTKKVGHHLRHPFKKKPKTNP